jgi:hypothetical protein
MPTHLPNHKPNSAKLIHLVVLVAWVQLDGMDVISVIRPRSERGKVRSQPQLDLHPPCCRRHHCTYTSTFISIYVTTTRVLRQVNTYCVPGASGHVVVRQKEKHGIQYRVGYPYLDPRRLLATDHRRLPVPEHHHHLRLDALYMLDHVIRLGRHQHILRLDRHQHLLRLC